MRGFPTDKFFVQTVECCGVGDDRMVQGEIAHQVNGSSKNKYPVQAGVTRKGEPCLLVSVGNTAFKVGTV